jgi:competence protein ComEA
MRSAWQTPERLAVAAAAMLVWVAAEAAVDVNRADQATLESVKGLGPTLVQAILDERAKAPFRSWADLLARVKGLGSASAARLSTAGLTVEGAAFEPMPATPIKP